MNCDNNESNFKYPQVSEVDGNCESTGQNVVNISDTVKQCSQICSNENPSHAVHNLIPPPRPFKKARYAWEIKNYEYTLNRMMQSMGYTENTERVLPHCGISSDNSHHSDNSNLASDMFSNNHSFNGSSYENLSQSMPDYQANYAAIMSSKINAAQYPFYQCLKNCNLDCQNSESPNNCLINWHAKQLCKSIFDRMVENMGLNQKFVNSNPVQMFNNNNNNNNDERNNVEELQNKILESQVLSSVNFQHKGVVPPLSFNCEIAESTTTSDYDSSEEESELEGITEDSSIEHQNSFQLSPMQQSEMNNYFRFANLAAQQQSQAFTQIGIDKTEFFSPQSFGQVKDIDRRCATPQSFCDEPTSCDSNFVVPKISNTEDDSDSLPNSGTKGDKNQVFTEVSDTTVEEIALENLPKCRSRECDIDDENSINKKLKLDKNENCIETFEYKKSDDSILEDYSENSETIIKGKVKKAIFFKTEEMEVDNEVMKSVDDTYFVRNEIKLSIQSEGLAFQKA